MVLIHFPEIVVLDDFGSGHLLFRPSVTFSFTQTTLTPDYGCNLTHRVIFGIIDSQ